MLKMIHLLAAESQPRVRFYAGSHVATRTSKKPSTLPGPQDLKTDGLRFDEENPRITELLGQNPSQDEILEALWHDFAVDEVALSIAANGFFRHEPLLAEGDGTVVEGNRRLAAVHLLRSPEKRRAVGATDLPPLTPAQRKALDTLPVITAKRADVWQFTGFKHINGPQAWSSEAKSQYIAWVHDDLNVSLDKIAQTIGDTHQTVGRLYHARRVLRQAEEARLFQVEDRYKRHFSFSHLYTGLGYAGIQKFLGIDSQRATSKKPVPKAKQDNLGELMIWLYGSKSREQAPVVKSQNPDLRRLDEVLQRPDGVTALRRGLPLDVALDIARGDERIFREAVQRARESLKTALGTAVTGYAGDEDLLQSSEEIVRLARKLEAEMSQIATDETPKRKATRRRGQ